MVARLPGRRLGALLAVTVAGGYGVLAGLWTPRGPLTTSEALVAMALGLSVGLLAGALLRSRWAMLLAPVAFVAVFELVRIGAVGATVDGIHPGSPFGALAFVLGRGVHGLLTLMPMLLLTVALIRPARTAPILDTDGNVLAGSVTELATLDAGGRELSVMLRGNSDRNPVLLFLAGGPGGTELGAMRRHASALEEDFVVATLDQRGTGKSYDAFDPASSLTLAEAIADVVEVTRQLRTRFGQGAIYLMGNSWGTLLGVLAVQQHPELYRAYIGFGQMVSIRATDRITYADTLAWAVRTGDTGLADTLTAHGPPPYTDVLDYEPATLLHEGEVYPYDHEPNSEGAGGFGENLFVGEYTLLEQLHDIAAFLDVASVMYPQLQEVDLRTQATRLDVPVYLVQGRFEIPGRAQLADEWFDRLDAPSKRRVVLDTAGHRPLFEQPAAFHDFLTDVVLPETAATR